MDAGQAAQMFAAKGERPDVIVVDPPAQGRQPDVIEAMAAMGPRRIVYVSCDPATLAATSSFCGNAAMRCKPPRPSTSSQDAPILRRYVSYPGRKEHNRNALPPIGVILWAASLMKCEEHLQAGADAMEQRVRICDIAEELGLSTATGFQCDPRKNE